MKHRANFAVQDAIAADLGKQADFKVLARDSSGKPRSRGTDNEEAYRNYQQAITLIDQQRPGSAQKANEYLDRALQLDPNYARAWAGKANANSVAWNSNRFSDNGKLYQISMESAQRAISIDPNIPKRYTSLCDSKFFTNSTSWKPKRL
jgi:adenylate cyclase